MKQDWSDFSQLASYPRLPLASTGVNRLTIIDARAADRPETGGVERWARELSHRLPELRPDAYKVASPGMSYSHRLGQFWEQGVLPLKARQQEAGVILCPANLAPLASTKNIVVIHDVAPLRFPRDFSFAYRTWQQFLLPRIADRALKVIVPSEFSKSELIDCCDIDPGAIEVVYPGVPDDVFAGGDVEAVREKFELANPYVLTVASKVRRKNLSALIPLAMELEQIGVDVVAAGGTRPHLGSEVQGGEVRELGPVEAGDLPSLYRGAAAFVLPSRYEGFGLPVCEAMAAGVPVVTTTAASLPEAAGGAALLVDPDDHAGLIEAVKSAVLDQDLRTALIAKGTQRVEGLTWAETAQRVDAVVRAVTG